MSTLEAAPTLRSHLLICTSMSLFPLPRSYETKIDQNSRILHSLFTLFALLFCLQWGSHKRYPISTRIHLSLLSRLCTLRYRVLTRRKPNLQVRRRRRRSLFLERRHFPRNSLRLHQGKCSAQQLVVEVDLLEGDGGELEEARQATQLCFGETPGSRLGRAIRKPQHYSVSRHRVLTLLPAYRH